MFTSYTSNQCAENLTPEIESKARRGEVMRYWRVFITLLFVWFFALASVATTSAQAIGGQRFDDTELSTHLALGGYITAAFMDASITSYCHGKGVCQEQNPLLRPIVDRRGVVIAMTVKGAEHAAISGLLLRYHKAHPRTVFWATIALTAVQVYVDTANVRTLGGVR